MFFIALKRPFNNTVYENKKLFYITTSVSNRFSTFSFAKKYIFTNYAGLH